MTYSGQDLTKENYIIPTHLNTNIFLQNISLSFGEGFSEDILYTIHSLYNGITNVKMGHIIQYFNHQVRQCIKNKSTNTFLFKRPSKEIHWTFLTVRKDFTTRLLTSIMLKIKASFPCSVYIKRKIISYSHKALHRFGDLLKSFLLQQLQVFAFLLFFILFNSSVCLEHFSIFYFSLWNFTL